MPDLDKDIEFQRTLAMGPHGKATRAATAAILVYVLAFAAVAVYCAAVSSHG